MKKRVLEFGAVGLMTMFILAGCGSSYVGNNVDVSNEGTIVGDEITETKTDKAYDIIGFSSVGGVFATEFDLVLENVEDEGTIVYTLNGDDPTGESAIEYTEPIRISKRDNEPNVVSAVSPQEFCGNYTKINSSRDGFECWVKAPADDAVDKCTVVRAAIRYEDGSFSKVYTNTYYIGTMTDHIPGIQESVKAAGRDVAVVSITMNYDDLFDEKKGIYVKGELFDKALNAYLNNETLTDADIARRLDSNYNSRGREWERNAHIDFFECDGSDLSLAFSQDCGIRIQGNYSRSDLQKGFRLYARDDYGDKRFRYPIFGDDAVDKDGNIIEDYKTFILRAGGNCAFGSKFNDVYWQELVSRSGNMNSVSTMANRPCVVYLNGEYWGLYVMEEDFSQEYFEDHYGVDSDSVVLYKGDAEKYEIGYKLDLGTLPEGESFSYFFKDLKDFMMSHKSLEKEEDYEEFIKLVDEKSVMDYYLAEIWLNNKWDWPGKNWSMWKVDEESLLAEKNKSGEALEGLDESVEYNDGRWRFCLYDVEFGGFTGEWEARDNTIKVANYKDYGLLDRDTRNISVLVFSSLMSNEGFRNEFCDRLLALGENEFAQEKALALLDEYKSIYGPLYEQFFKRYTVGSKDDAFGSINNVKGFLEKRKDNIQPMVDFVHQVMD